MEVIRRAINDIRRGEKIDLYLTVIVALGAALLNIIGYAPPALLGSLTLAILAVIAAAMLVIRYRLEDLQRTMNETGQAGIRKEFPAEISEDTQNASEVWIFGVHVLGFIRSHNKALEDSLRQHRKVRFLLVDPSGNAVIMAAARSAGKIAAVERERAGILASLAEICELKKISPDTVEVRVIDDPLLFGGCIMNPNSFNGKAYIQRYSYQTGIRPKYVWDARSEWFGLVKLELESLWSRGRNYDCTEASKRTDSQ